MYVDPSGTFGGLGLLAISKELIVAFVAVFAFLPIFVETLCDITGAITADIQNWFNSIEEEREAEKDAVETVPPKNQAVFTVNPYDFNPNGLERVEYLGTSNGRIIKWRDPASKVAIFEWDEDFNNGSHYHILSNGKHIGDHIPPNTLVPEPYNSIYFGGKQ